MVSPPLRAGQPARQISPVRMVAPRATACRVEARVPSARVSAWAVAASWGQAALAGKWLEGRWAKRTVDQIGGHLLDHRVPPVVGLGLGQRQRAVGEHRVVAVGGKQLTLALGGGFRVDVLNQPPSVRWVRWEANAV
jgi:hypothetical protein